MYHLKQLVEILNYYRNHVRAVKAVAVAVATVLIVFTVSARANVIMADTTHPVLSSLKSQVKKARDSVSAVPGKMIKETAEKLPFQGKGQLNKDTIRAKAIGQSDEDSVTADPPSFYVAQRRGCKNFSMEPIWMYTYVPVILEHVPTGATPVKKTPFLQVHGNVLYNVNYYSNIDTPYNEKNVYQHTIQTYLDVLVKGQYPMRIYITNRFSNSSVFRNLNDFNFSYTNSQFNQLVKDNIRKRFMASLPSPRALDSLQHLMDTVTMKLKSLENWVKNPAIIQKMIEERERLWKEKLTGIKDTLSVKVKPQFDSIPLAEEYAMRKVQVDSLKNRLVALQQLLKNAYVQSKTNINRIAQNIEQADNPAKLKAVMQELNLPDTILPKGYKPLMAIRSFSLGRSVVNYSELSVKNISVNGVQAEYNPSAYYAVATGKVDYRFRDFIVKSPGQSGQYLTVLRYGRGSKDGNNVIFTYFNGKKQLYNSSTSDTQQVQIPAATLMGFTVEGNYRLTNNITVTGEVAKSSMPGYVTDASGKTTSLPSQMFDFSKRTNEAYAVKGNVFFPKTFTRLKGGIKHLGIHYQSFSVFTDGSSQTAWSVSVNQLFFKKQLDVTVGANTNDFSNPLAGASYKSTTVFKSIQATLRKRRWPIISVGYFPSSQITKLGDGHFTENLYYTLTGNITHTYSVGQLMMNSTAVYTQFYNKATDSGFVYFNTRNVMLGQSFFFQQLTLQGNASTAINQEYNLYTLEAKGQYVLNKYLTVGAGLKYNRQTNYDINQTGYNGEMILNIPKLGQIQFSADKGFIPGPDKKLVTNNTGRITYFKTF